MGGNTLERCKGMGPGALVQALAGTAGSWSAVPGADATWIRRAASRLEGGRIGSSVPIVSNFYRK